MIAGDERHLLWRGARLRPRSCRSQPRRRLCSLASATTFYVSADVIQPLDLLVRSRAVSSLVAGAAVGRGAGFLAGRRRVVLVQ